jgi:hypothetical protein
MNHSDCPQELALSLAAGQIVTTNHREHKVSRQQPPSLSLARNIHGSKPVCVDPAVDDTDFRVVSKDWWTRAAFWFQRSGFVDPFTQYRGDEIGDGNHRAALSENEATTKPRARAFGEVARKDEYGAAPGKSSRQNSRPEVTAVVSMDDLDI